jgi:hypothetical protein
MHCACCRWAKTFGLPEVLMMLELHQRAPMLLRNTVVMVRMRALRASHAYALFAPPTHAHSLRASLACAHVDMCGSRREGHKRRQPCYVSGCDAMRE